MYKAIRSLLFFFDPEWVHYFSMNALKMICRVEFLKQQVVSLYKPASSQLPYTIFGLHFPNRVGLGAGFDKNARYLSELETIGFGFVEIGTVTPLPQVGNDKPRLFRLADDKALINRMGFNNDGVTAVAERLKIWRSTASNKLIIGGNIGKNKHTKNEEAWMDYEKCFLALHEHVDYFVVNVSSPNTPGLRELQDKDALSKILTNLQRLNAEKLHPKPLLLKIAPDLNENQLDDVIGLALEIKLDGLVASNTTIDRENLSVIGKQKAKEFGAGGLSGAPLKQRSTTIVKYINERANGKLPVIASGGIFTAADALEKIEAGASMVQVWTGFIYEGPGIVKDICNRL